MKISRVSAFILICLLLIGLRIAPAMAQIENPCPGFNSQNAQCSSAYIPGIMSYCGQGGSECSRCNCFQQGIINEMNYHRAGGGGNTSFLFTRYWNNTVQPGIQTILSRIVQAVVRETASRGSLFEAQNNVGAMQNIREISAGIATDYLPSEALCRYGTLSRNLAADEALANAAQQMISVTGLKRNMGSSESIGQAGRAADQNARMTEFIKEYCDVSQNNEGLSRMCGTGSDRRFEDLPKDTRFNRDINYARTVDAFETIDFSTSTTEDLRAAEQDVNSLANNLYGSRQMSNRVPFKNLRNREGKEIYLQTRSVNAARNVAQNSYAAITGMKIRGSGGTQQYMRALLRNLGAEPNTEYLNQNPSYYAQMSFLTKRLYQDPSFYVNLMEGRTNVMRQSAAMEGIETMQDRDIYRSMKRSEMLLALLVQLQSKNRLSDIAEELEVK
jgi:hypothetical protein